MYDKFIKIFATLVFVLFGLFQTSVLAADSPYDKPEVERKQTLTGQPKDQELAGKSYPIDILLSYPCEAIELRTPYSTKNVVIRLGSTDAEIFRDVFLQKEYSYPVDEKSVEYILDCGAYAGYTALFFNHLYPKAKIIAIEPELENFEVLKKNCSHIPQVHLVQGAVWNKTTLLNLISHNNDTGEFLGAWGIQTEENKQDKLAKDDRKTYAYSIKDLMRQYNLPRIDILKINIEGAEKEVFSSQEMDWLDSTKTIIVEVHDRFKPGCTEAVMKAASKSGFRITERRENILFLTRP